MKLPYKVEWRQIIVFLMCWVLASFFDQSGAAIVIMLSMVVAQLIRIAEAMENRPVGQRGKEN